MLPELREEVFEANMMLPENNLVVGSGGNVSGRDPETGLVIIKPSGVKYRHLKAEDLVVTDLEGNVVEGELKPSVDLGIHLYLYQRRPDVFGITHTHQPYATSFALLSEDLPAALTPLSHMIGAGVPCTRYATPGAVDTGEAIMEVVGDTGLCALADRHGIFTMGKSGPASVNLALYIEEAAKTIRMAQIAGKVTPLDDAEVKRSAEWFKVNYGQG